LEKVRTNDDFLLFSFKHLVKGYDLKACPDKNIRSQLLDKLRILSEQTHQDLATQPREKGGFERIPVEKIKNHDQVNVNQDIAKFYVFRFSQSRLIGYFVNNQYFITHIDWKLDAYKH
jgi:hypothetical protein